MLRLPFLRMLSSDSIRAIAFEQEICPALQMQMYLQHHTSLRRRPSPR
jgi:hypothetical protein